MQKTLLLLLLLAACTPTQISNTLTADGAVCSLERKTSSAVQVTVNGGTRAMQDATLRLDGRNLSSVDLRCTAREGGLDCRLGTLVSSVVSVNASSVGGSVSFYRAGSDMPHLALCGVRR